MVFEAKSVELRGGFSLGMGVEEAFPLFSPRGEEAWVPGWTPQILDPPGAVWEEGMVFRTVHDGEESVWFVTSLDRAAHRVTYRRVDIGLAAVTVSVACDETDGGTDVRVNYRFVGITEKGNSLVASQGNEAFAGKMRGWKERIDAM